MKFQDYKLIFIAVGLIGTLLIASPALASFIQVPSGEQFSELYLLGPNKTADNYPFNIVIGQNYTIYAETTNHLGSSAYYVLEIKLKNQTDAFPNPNSGTPSPLFSLFESRFSIADGQSFETPIKFSVTNGAISQNQSIIKTLMINNSEFEVNKPAAWNSNSTTFSYQIIFELWLYNAQTQSVEFNNRYVHLQLNLTAT